MWFNYPFVGEDRVVQKAEEHSKSAGDLTMTLSPSLLSRTLSPPGTQGLATCGT